MSKWQEYANEESDFPIIWTSSVCGDFYEAEYVQDWLKRCLKNFPLYRAFSLEAHKNAVKEWHDRWFSQFIEKGDKDE